MALLVAQMIHATQTNAATNLYTSKIITMII